MPNTYTPSMINGSISLTKHFYIIIAIGNLFEIEIPLVLLYVFITFILAVIKMFTFGSHRQLLITTFQNFCLVGQLNSDLSSLRISPSFPNRKNYSNKKQMSKCE